ncbi:hypothetical protein [Methylobacter luteus]|uniref:hypothetical protein n=1 Tax=Methylobacter luteus TaxID=415 RepID=UPI0004279161|nr:hypothetical protein [Methylobacter luteus]
MRLRLLWFVLVAMIFSAPAMSHSNNGSNNNQLPESLEQKVRNLQADLEAKGYKVTRGFWDLFTIEDCQFSIAVVGNCFGNNPASPYINPSVPLWPDEFVDEHIKDLLGPMPEDTQVNFRLDEREALVVLAQLPPPGKFFGMHTYVFSREGIIDPANLVFQSVTDPFLRDLLFAASPTPSRSQVLATFGNSINNVVIERQSGAAFDQQRFFIITPDAVMERAVTEALLRAGVPDRNQVFTTPVSTEVFRAGLGPEADDLSIFIRYTRPEDEAAGEQWRQQLPLAVLRVRDMNTARPTEPYPKPAYDERIARSELGLQGEFAALIEAVKQHWGQTFAPEQPFQNLELAVDLVGQHCLERPMNCIGDNQDEDWRLSQRYSIDSGQVLAVMGTLKTATGNATYSSIALNRSSVLQGIGNVFDEELAGTASAFSETVGNTDPFYVQYFARDCTGLSHCFEVTEEMIPKGETVTFIERNYVVPGTARGADSRQMLTSLVIVFDGKARPQSP